MWRFKKNVLCTDSSNIECPINAVNDTAIYTGTTPRNVNVLLNDGVISSPVVTIITPPTHGTATIHGTLVGVIVYTNDGGGANDSLVYQVSNGYCSDTATLSLSKSSGGGTPDYYNIHFSNSTSSSACSSAYPPTTFPLSLYVEFNPITVGMFVYNNSGLTSPFNGDGTWYSFSSMQSVRIISTGEVTEVDYSCYDDLV